MLPTMTHTLRESAAAMRALPDAVDRARATLAEASSQVAHTTLVLAVACALALLVSVVALIRSGRR